MSCEPPTQCGPHAGETWVIDATILNILWGDIWPRVIAQGWAAWGAYPIPFGPVDPLHLSGVLDNLAKIDKETPPSWNIGDHPVTRFHRRVARVKSYLAGKEVIRMNFVGECGYDFILSDAGLDLFAPLMPEEDFELYRYYSFRRTGRPSLGVPTYLDDPAVLTFSVDAPTGPGQVFTTHAALDGISPEWNECRLRDLDCLRWHELDKAGSPSEWRQQPHVGFSYIDYLSAVGNARCWQVEGSVYRGILDELPRVVAEIWIERAFPVGGSRTYSARFTSSKAREIFMERIETSLPDTDEMDFNVVSGLADVRITNKGFYLPAISEGRPARDVMLNAIIAGRAGNPVFTDSKRPDGDE